MSASVFARVIPAARSRTVVMAVACLGHVGLILLLLNSLERVRQRAPEREAEPLLLMLLDSLVRPETEPRRVEEPVLAPPTAISTLPLPEIDSSSSGSALPPVSDSVPSVDWIDARHRAVDAAVERDAAAAARPRLGQPPKGMDLPHEAFEHKLGVVEHREGGEIIEWINDRCYYTNKRRPGENAFGLLLPVCKTSKPQKELRLDKRPEDVGLP